MKALARAFVAVTVPLLLELSVPEFLELRRLSPEAVRARFDLPDDCAPVVSAMRPAGKANRIIVLLDCHRSEVVPSRLSGP